MGWSDRQSAKEKHLPSRRAARPSSAVSSTDKVTKKLTRRTSENIFNKSRRSGRSGRCADDMVLSEYTVGAIGSAGRTSRDKRRKVRASSASGVRSSTRVSPPRQRQASAEEAPTPNKEWSGDTSSMREKIRTYRLRLAGQLQTIRSLEVKLGEAELDLRAKDASLNETRQRLQALERREKNSFLRGVASDEPEPALIPLATRERDAIRKLKTQIADLQEKVKEGNLKIRQGNERYKIAKTALDRSSSEQDAAKTNAAKLELTLSDTQNALIRSRRECKELSSQVEAFKGQIHARQEAEESLQKELLRAEGTLREIRSENDSYREDLSRQSKELGFLQEGNRRMELELRLLREKDAVHKLEKRALSKVITHSKTTHPPDTHEDGRINCEYDSEEDRRENRKAANVVRSKSALGGMDSVLAWEKDYTRRRQQRLQRDESLSPPRSPPRSTRRNNGKCAVFQL